MRTRRFTSSSDPVSSDGDHKSSQVHHSVLLHEAIELLAIKPTDVVMDATLGGAGHARAIADKLSSKGTLIGFDLDADAIERAEAALAGAQPEVHIINANFRDCAAEITKRGLPHPTKALFDLGWSSYQLQVGRGFSFTSDEPLLMTYTKNPDDETLTAAQIVNEWEEESIADVLYGWGEEKYSRRIAHAIVERRTQKPFETSRDLADTIRAAVPPIYRFGRIHPATRTFQALRIAVNDEMGALYDGLAKVWGSMRFGGRIAVISFHSIEDRIVKQVFLEWEKEGMGQRITKSPVIPNEEETSSNPRARSAKLRVIERL